MAEDFNPLLVAVCKVPAPSFDLELEKKSLIGIPFSEVGSRESVFDTLEMAPHPRQNNVWFLIQLKNNPKSQVM